MVVSLKNVSQHHQRKHKQPLLLRLILQLLVENQNIFASAQSMTTEMIQQMIIFAFFALGLLDKPFSSCISQYFDFDTSNNMIMKKQNT